MDAQISYPEEFNQAQVDTLSSIKMHMGQGGILAFQRRDRKKRAVFRMPGRAGKTTLCKLIHSQPNVIRPDAEDIMGPVYLVVPSEEAAGEATERILVGPHLVPTANNSSSNMQELFANTHNKRELCCGLKCNQHLKWVRTLEKPPGYIFDELNYSGAEQVIQHLVSEREDAVVICVGTTLTTELLCSLLLLDFCYCSPCDWRAWGRETNGRVVETYRNPRDPLDLQVWTMPAEASGDSSDPQ